MSLKRPWIDGGLLILMPRSHLAAWGGCDGDGYDRARAADAGACWLLPFDTGAGSAFLLAGDPGMALCVHRAAGDVDLIRWVYAEDEEALVAFALSGEGATRDERPVALENVEPRWVLFNAADDPARNDDAESRPVNLPLGRIMAHTEHVERGRNAAIVHRFRRAAP